MAAALCYFYLKSSPQAKMFLSSTCINTNPGLYSIGYNQASYVGGGTCLEWLPPLGKSASLGKG